MAEQDTQGKLRSLTSQKMQHTLTIIIVSVFISAFLFLGLDVLDNLMHRPGQGLLYISLLAGGVGSGLGVVKTCLATLEARITLIEKSLQELKK